MTGPFSYPFGLVKEVKMGDIYKAITDSHFNVNIDRGLREEQRKKIFAQYGPPSSGPPPQELSEKVGHEFEKKKKRWSVKALFKRTTRVA